MNTEPQGITVLVADDEPDLRSLVEVFLKRRGYKVIHARDGAETKKLITEYDPDLCFLDIMMPKANGWDVLDYVKNSMPDNDTKIVMLSTQVRQLSDEKAMVQGADGYLPKPFTPSQLLDTVDEMLPQS